MITVSVISLIKKHVNFTNVEASHVTTQQAKEETGMKTLELNFPEANQKTLKERFTGAVQGNTGGFDS